MLDLQNFEANLDYFYALAGFLDIRELQLIELQKRLSALTAEQQCVAVYLLQKQQEKRSF